MRIFASLFGNKALSDLSNLDDRRLADLGLCRYDLFDAGRSRNASELLKSRRNERATYWLR